jgi:hypothetical protein
MKPGNAAVSACRYCRFYQSEGRRGGSCHQLGVPVQGNWKACSIAATPFTTKWEELINLDSWCSGSAANGAEPGLATPLLAVEAKLPVIGLSATLSESDFTTGSEEILLNIE